MVIKNICIIPARGGSKRIPRKNIIDFFDKPMIAWTIEAAKKSNLFDQVFVSTDCEKIAEVARSHGAEVPFLREIKNDDVSPVSEATIASLNQIEERLGVRYDNVVQLMANCPLRNSDDIIKSFQVFLDHNLNFQISSYKYGWMNPWWAFTIEDNKPVPIFPEALKARSQDLPDLYCPTGAIWIAKTKELKMENSFYGHGYRLCEIDWISAIDIDDESDLKMAKIAYMMKNDMQKGKYGDSNCL